MDITQWLSEPWNKGGIGIYSLESLEKMRTSHLGKEFTKNLKTKIRIRDNFICSNCDKKENRLLSIHHIDYNKNNNNPQNLLSLCKSCHSKTNINREKWKQNLKEKIKEKYNDK